MTVTLLEDIDPQVVGEMAESPSVFVENVLGDDPFDYQAAILDSPSDRTCLQCGRQVGKSRIASWKALHKPVTTPGSTTLILAPARRQSSELFHQIEVEIDESPLPKEAFQVVRQTKTIMEFANGSRIIALPITKDGRTIRTYSADLVIVDEAAFVARNIFEDVLKPMLATTNGDMLIASTPFGTSGYFYEAADQNPTGEWDVFQHPMSDSPLIDDEFIERERQSKDPISFKQEVLGEFAAAADAFIDPETVRKCLGESLVDLHPTTPDKYLGADPAAMGDDWAVFVSMDGNGVVYDVQAYQRGRLTECMDMVKELEAEHQYTKIFIDLTGLGEGVVDQLHRDELYNLEGIRFTPKEKESIFTTFKSHLQSGSITIPSDVPDLRDQIVGLRYELNSNTGRMSIKPSEEMDHDDYADAAALANWARAGNPGPATRRAPSTAAKKRSIINR